MKITNPINVFFSISMHFGIFNITKMSAIEICILIVFFIGLWTIFMWVWKGLKIIMGKWKSKETCEKVVPEEKS